MEDIEDFLLGELSNAIKDTKESFRSSSILVECGRLKDLILNKKKNTGAAVDVIRRENLYYLNNIVAEWLLILEKHNQLSPAAQIAMNGKFNDRLKKIREELELEAPPEVDKQKAETSKHDKEKVDDEAAQKDGVYDQKPRGLRNPYHVKREKIWGIDDKSKAMERLLVRKETRNKEFQAIGIVGMTGVGKTTFCQVAFNNEEVKKHFLPRIWVEMSEQPKDEEEYKKEMVKSFLRSLGFEDKVITEIGDSGGLRLLLLALRKQLQGKRYLVVLDDIWHLDENYKEFCSSLEDGGEEYKPSLSYGLPKGSCGCVIVTSRSEVWAANMVGEKNLQRLTPLEDEESIWKIFKNGILDKGYWLGPHEKKIRGEIVTRCAGLPLIAKMLGEIMIKRYVDDKGKGNGPLVA